MSDRCHLSSCCVARSLSLFLPLSLSIYLSRVYSLATVYFITVFPVLPGPNASSVSTCSVNLEDGQGSDERERERGGERGNKRRRVRKTTDIFEPTGLLPRSTAENLSFMCARVCVQTFECVKEDTVSRVERCVWVFSLTTLLIEGKLLELAYTRSPYLFVCYKRESVRVYTYVCV